MIGYRIELELLHPDVVEAIAILHKALVTHTDYDGAQITFDAKGYNIPTVDVQVTE